MKDTTFNELKKKQFEAKTLKKELLQQISYSFYREEVCKSEFMYRKVTNSLKIKLMESAMPAVFMLAYLGGYLLGKLFAQVTFCCRTQTNDK